MQDSQALLLPQQLRKKSSQRDNRGSISMSDGNNVLKHPSQHVWKPAGCHSMHTTGVEGAHLLHPFSRPTSPSQSQRSCSSEAFRSCGKENQVASVRGSRIFKQGRVQDHPQASSAQHPAPRALPPHIIYCQGILRLSDPLECSFSNGSRSPPTHSRRSALGDVSNTHANLDSMCHSNSSILQQLKPQPCSPLSTQQDLQQLPTAGSPSSHGCDGSRRLSCGSASTGSDYTPGTRGTPQTQYLSPLRDALQARQRQRHQISGHTQHPSSPYLHALAREIEQQQQQGQRSSGSNRSTSPPGGINLHKLNVRMHESITSTRQHQQQGQQPQCSLSAVYASIPLQPLHDAALAEPGGDYYSPAPPQQQDPYQQQFHLTPCYEDANECDATPSQGCFGSAGHNKQQPAGTTVQRISPSHQHSINQHLLQPAQQHQQTVASDGLKPAAPSATTTGLQHDGPQQVQLQDQPVLAATDQPQLQHAVAAQQQCRDDPPVTHADYDKYDGLLEQEQLRRSGLLLPVACEQDAQQRRRQQWRAHQQLQQQQRWLHHMELQQQHKACRIGDDSKQQQHTQQEPPAAASPAATAAADYSHIMQQAQAMAQKSEAAWAQLTKYQQQRVCGRLPGSSSSTSRLSTPTPLTGSRQLSRLGPAAASHPTPSALQTAVSPTPRKTLGSALLHMSSPAVYHTPTGDLSSSTGSSSSTKKVPPPPPAFLCTAAAYGAAAVQGCSRIASLPGSPAAALQLSSSSFSGSGHRTHSTAEDFSLSHPLAVAAAVQSLRDSKESARAATRASIAASLKSSFEGTPRELPPIPTFDELATQPTVVWGIHQYGDDSTSSSSTVMPRAAGMQSGRSNACPPLPASPAWSVYLTPTAAEPAATAATTSVSGSALIRGGGTAAGEYAGSATAWWRTPGDEQPQQQQLQAVTSDTAVLVAGNSPATCVKPKDLLGIFDNADHLSSSAAGAAGRDARAGGMPVALAIANRADVGSAAGAVCGSNCSNMDGFPFTPTGTRSLRSSSNSLFEQQGIGQHSEPADVGLLATDPTATIEEQGSHGADKDLEWLHKYLDAKSAAAVTADEDGMDSSMLGHGMSQHPVSSITAAAVGVGYSDSGRSLMNQQKETWTVHNNWVATDLDIAAEGVHAMLPTAVASHSIADALPPGSTAENNSSEHTPLQPIKLHHQQRQPAELVSSEAISSKHCNSSSSRPVEYMADVTPILENLTPAQALAAYTQLAHKLKRRMDETAGDLLARLNLSSPVPDVSSSAAAATKEEQRLVASGGTAEGETGVGTGVLSAVTCKQDVGMVVVSPHNACGRWQPSRPLRE